MPLNKMTRPAFIAAVLLVGIACNASAADRVSVESYGGRSLIAYVPSQLPPSGGRALVIVLHGGLGNAQRIESQLSESGLNMDAAADKNGFVVAYLNGTPVTRRRGPDMLGWNAGGGCCGLSAENNIDDIGYIRGAVDYLAGRYGIDHARVYGMGHSNGAMMVQRLLCETTLFAAGISISGPLNLNTASCPGARGKRILAIHGSDDANVPVAGGRGIGIANVAYTSEDFTRKVFTDSGASYELDLVSGADHKLDHIDAAIQKAEGQTIAEKATKFFGLAQQTP